MPKKSVGNYTICDQKVFAERCCDIKIMRPCGLMDIKASVSGAADCRFESCHGRHYWISICAIRHMHEIIIMTQMLSTSTEAFCNDDQVSESAHRVSEPELSPASCRSDGSVWTNQSAGWQVSCSGRLPLVSPSTTSQQCCHLIIFICEPHNCDN